MPEQSTILVVDDEPAILEVMRLNLATQGYRVETAPSGREGLDVLVQTTCDAVIVDYKMPEMTGIEFLEQTRGKYPDLPVIMVTAFGSIEMAVEAMKKGAFNYLTKPLNYEEMFLLLKQAVEKKHLVEDVRGLRKEVKKQYRFERIITNNKKMLDLLGVVDNVAGTDATVMIRGETGTGKELIARAIHYNSPRSEKVFVKINCTALPDTLLETELFGHVRGAFTGAHRDRRGRFEQADGGTLFLDEIGDISMSMQAKLLRVLQEMEFERLGSNETVRIDVRVVASTNVDMEEAIRKGRFREDLYFRLNVVPIVIPPLRERKDDIYLLANTFLERFNEKHKKAIQVIPSELLTRFLQYDWPGNVRELENNIERGVVLSRGDILDVQHFQIFPTEVLERKKTEKDFLLELEEKYSGFPNTLAMVAKELGINVSTLYRKRKKYGLI
ncbi:MAG: sigma-54-dependent Fis family transcriptional regulator [Deltaproteobacteria bacterium]|nr:sigma-54-dependent Fis family transcriptional regulator [Deltaproteobacteria bacterium]